MQLAVTRNRDPLLVWLVTYDSKKLKFLKHLIQEGLQHPVYCLPTEPIEGCQKIEQDLSRLSESTKITFVATSGLPEHPGKCVHLVQDGRDCLVELAGRQIENHTFERTLTRLVRDKKGWGAHTLAWTETQHKSFRIDFHQLLSEPQPQFYVLGIQGELGLNTDFELASSEKESVRLQFPQSWISESTKFTGLWKTRMPPSLLSAFWNLHGAAMDAVEWEPFGEIWSLHKEIFSRESESEAEQVNQSTLLEKTEEIHQLTNAIHSLKQQLELSFDTIESLSKARERELRELDDKERVIQHLLKSDRECQCLPCRIRSEVTRLFRAVLRRLKLFN